MRKRLGIIGHFGGGNDFFDGQTVKTKVLYQELSERGFENIFCVDTYYNKTNKIRLLWNTFLCFLKCKTIIVLLSENGLKIYLPMLSSLKKVFGFKVFHDVIGGSLADYIDKNPKYAGYLKSFENNWVETQKMKDELKIRGVNNCVVVPNFKRLSSDKAELTLNEDSRYKFCMFSRVMEEKGVTLAIETIGKYNENSERKVILEIWGPIEENYSEKFSNLLKEHGDYVKYMGCVEFAKSVEAITGHAALLFPTFWKSEGFPGTIIDAYTAGVPVVASDWNSNSELIKDFETGWVYPNEKVKNLYESIVWAVENAEHMTAMRRNCTLIAKHYSADYVMDRVIREIK